MLVTGAATPIDSFCASAWPAIAAPNTAARHSIRSSTRIVVSHIPNRADGYSLPPRRPCSISHRPAVAGSTEPYRLPNMANLQFYHPVRDRGDLLALLPA